MYFVPRHVLVCTAYLYMCVLIYREYKKFERLTKMFNLDR